MPSMMRRIRTRLPTYLSTGFGALVDISNSPWILAPGAKHRLKVLQTLNRQIPLGGRSTSGS
jgi:hypothetical protein